jgi:DNA-binding protein HU-beta
MLCGATIQWETIVKAPELIDHVAAEAGIDKKAAKKAVTAFVEGIVDSVKKGEEVVLPGFGKFAMKDTPARTGRNPSTGEPIDIAAGKRLSFAPAKAIRDQMTS